MIAAQGLLDVLSRNENNNEESKMISRDDYDFGEVLATFHDENETPHMLRYADGSVASFSFESD